MITTRWISRSWSEDRVTFLKEEGWTSLEEDPGIRIHTNWIAIFILTCCGKITAIQGENGEWLHLSRDSFKVWCEGRGVSSIPLSRDHLIRVVKQIEGARQTYRKCREVVEKIFCTFDFILRDELRTSYLKDFCQLREIFIAYTPHGPYVPVPSKSKEEIDRLIEALPTTEQQSVIRKSLKKSSMSRQAALASFAYQSLRNLPCLTGSAERGGILRDEKRSIFFKCTADFKVHVIDLSVRRGFWINHGNTQIKRFYDSFNLEYVVMKEHYVKLTTLEKEYHNVSRVIDSRARILQEEDRPIAYMQLAPEEARKRDLGEEMMLMPFYPTTLESWTLDHKKKFKDNRHIEVVKQLWTIYQKLRHSKLRHLDFKVTNVCIDKNGRLVLIDWANDPIVRDAIPMQMTTAFIPDHAYDCLCSPSDTPQRKEQATAIIDRFAIGVAIYMALTTPRLHPYREFNSKGCPYDGWEGFNEEALKRHSYPKEVIAFVQDMCSLNPNIYDVSREGSFAEYEQKLVRAWEKVQKNCPEWA